jgi:hypothetical protein
VFNFESRILCEKCSEEAKTQGLSGGQGSTLSSPQPENAPSPEVFTPPPIPPRRQGYPYCPPVVSLLLGFIPGVGAICNGEYFKAFLQVLVFGSLISLSNSSEVADLGPIFEILTAAVYFYMPFEAYHIAKKRNLAVQGITVVTPFERIRFPDLWIGSLAVVAGAIFLINEFVAGTLGFVLRGWPLILIGIGVYNLSRYFGSHSTG